MPKKDMEKYYHLYSRPLKSPLFVNDDDRKFFLNRLALCYINMEFMIYAYCLMDNHIHMLVSGEEDTIKKAFLVIKRLYRNHINSREETVEIELSDFNISLRAIHDEDDFKGVVAYIMRNPYVAGISCPIGYKWSSCFLYFNSWRDLLRTVPAKEYGKRRLRQSIGTRTTIDGQITILDDVINPAIWCNYLKVEQIFRRSGDFFKLLAQWTIEKEEESRMTGAEINGYLDTELLTKVKEYCTMNGANSINELRLVELRNLVSMARRRWGASKKQLERTLGLSSALIDKYY